LATTRGYSPQQYILSSPLSLPEEEFSVSWWGMRTAGGRDS